MTVRQSAHNGLALEELFSFFQIKRCLKYAPVHNICIRSIISVALHIQVILTDVQEAVSACLFDSLHNLDIKRFDPFCELFVRKELIFAAKGCIINRIQTSLDVSLCQQAQHIGNALHSGKHLLLIPSEEINLHLSCCIIIDASLLNRMNAGCTDAMESTHGKYILITARQDLLGQFHLLFHELVFHGHNRNQTVIIVRSMDGSEYRYQILIHDLTDIRICIPKEIQMCLHTCLSLLLVCREMKRKAGRNTVDLSLLDCCNYTLFFRHVITPFLS